jgi:hypothetical protein
VARRKREPVLALLSNALEPIDLIAEGMWMVASGISTLGEWERLSESEHQWWRACARQAISSWMSSVNASER